MESVQDVVRFGLAYERTRAEVASYNLAMSNVALAAGQESPMKQVVLNSTFQKIFADAIAVERQTASRIRQVFEPTHALANAAGFVSYPQLDNATEMATLLSANRAYEANIRAYNSLREMNVKAFEIGK